MKMLLAIFLVLLLEGSPFAAGRASMEDLRSSAFALPERAVESAAPARPEEPVTAAAQLRLNNISNNQSLAVNQEVNMEGSSEGAAGGAIVRIAVLFNGSALGDAVLNGTAFSFRHTFAETAEQGRLELVGYDAAGAEAARAVYYVSVVNASELEGRYFNPYLLKATDWVKKRYGLLGYDINSVLTHDIVYHTSGTIVAKNPPLTMCVAAQMELILVAYQIYAEETGDYSPYAYLPRRSYEGQTAADLKGHIWVNPKFNSSGTADALINFGMGERTLFEKLRPGSFVNINRTNKTGHAVLFLGFIDAAGTVLSEYGPKVVGFKYYSSQGKSKAGEGGFDYRYAVFSKYGCPEMPGKKRDCNVIYSTKQEMLNTGTMLAPKFWKRLPSDAAFSPSGLRGETVLDKEYFNGVTTDD